MLAGFSLANITPPPGTTMMGVGERDLGGGSTGTHDDIYARVLYLQQGNEEALIISLDTCFIGRDQSDRLKGVLGRAFDLLPRQIMISATHSHAGPLLGDWYAGLFLPPDRLYLSDLTEALLGAALRARETAVEVTPWAGAGTSSLPMNRRRLVHGVMENAPNPAGNKLAHLPVLLLRATDSKAGEAPVACLFSISSHPSLVRGAEISAEFPGVACELLDQHLGSACSMFLQGTGGDSKPATIAAGDEWFWKAGWPEMEETGRILASEVKTVLEHLQPVEPQLGSALVEVQCPLQPAPDAVYFQRLLDDADNLPGGVVQVQWANYQLSKLDRYGELPTHAPVLLQGIHLGHDLHLVAIEGEPMACHGQDILELWPGATFPLGYANGEALYLVTSQMLAEGGMEAESYWEFGFPSPLAPGSEDVLHEGLLQLRDLLGSLP